MDLDACKLLFVLMGTVLSLLLSSFIEAMRLWDPETLKKDMQESYSPKEHETLLKESDMAEAT